MTPHREWFEAHVMEASDGCRAWPFERGYGRVTIDGVRQWVHILTCERWHGPKPAPDLEVAHSCGRGSSGCWAGEHLRWATRAENIADRVLHGTSNRGQRHGRSKLTDQDVLAIYRRYRAGGVQQRDLAREFGVSVPTVSMIVHGHRWGHLTGT